MRSGLEATVKPIKSVIFADPPFRTGAARVYERVLDECSLSDVEAMVERSDVIGVFEHMGAVLKIPKELMGVITAFMRPVLLAIPPEESTAPDETTPFTWQEQDLQEFLHHLQALLSRTGEFIAPYARDNLIQHEQIMHVLTAIIKNDHPAFIESLQTLLKNFRRDDLPNNMQLLDLVVTTVIKHYSLYIAKWAEAFNQMRFE